MDLLMWSTFFLLGAPAAVKLGALGVRTWGVRRVGTPDLAVRGRSARLFVAGGVVLGVRPGHPERVVVDLVTGGGRIVAATDRGVLFDTDATAPMQVRDARCTGPGRLVVEGALPERDLSDVRLEIPVPDAEGWAQRIKAAARAA